MKRIMIIFIALILVSGCLGQEKKEIKELIIPNHGQHIYEFSYDIRESFKIASNDPDRIFDTIWNAEKIYIVFNGSSVDDNAYSQVVLINLIAKLKPFFAYERKIVDYDTFYNAFYYVGDQWYNKSGEAVERPLFDDAVIWLLGPNTGANATYVNIENNIIYISGTSYENFVKAGDKFSLIVMGVEKIE